MDTDPPHRFVAVTLSKLVSKQSSRVSAAVLHPAMAGMGDTGLVMLRVLAQGVGGGLEKGPGKAIVGGSQLVIGCQRPCKLECTLPCSEYSLQLVQLV
jgi:hypothetical protein